MALSVSRSRKATQLNEIVNNSLISPTQLGISLFTTIFLPILANALYSDHALFKVETKLEQIETKLGIL